MNYYLKPSADSSHDFSTETSSSANPLSIMCVCVYAKDFVTYVYCVNSRCGWDGEPVRSMKLCQKHKYKCYVKGVQANQEEVPSV
jgi:hypothetical protein